MTSHSVRDSPTPAASSGLACSAAQLASLTSCCAYGSYKSVSDKGSQLHGCESDSLTSRRWLLVAVAIATATFVLPDVHRVDVLTFIVQTFGRVLRCDSTSWPRTGGLRAARYRRARSSCGRPPQFVLDLVALGHGRCYRLVVLHSTTIMDLLCGRGRASLGLSGSSGFVLVISPNS